MPIDGSKSVTPCDISDATIQSLKLLEFFYSAHAYLVPSCKGNNCIKTLLVTYKKV